MEDKRTAFALLLSIFVIMAYNEIVIAPLNPPRAPQQEINTESNPNSQTDTTGPQWSESTTQPTEVNNTGSTPQEIQPTLVKVSAETYRQSDKITIESPLYSAVISKLGGRLISFKLKNFRKELKSEELIEMVSPSSEQYPLGLSSGNFNDDLAQYQLRSVTDHTLKGADTYSVAPEKSLTVELAAQLNGGGTLTKSLTFEGSRYLLQVEAKLSGANNLPAELWLNWPEFIGSESKDTRYDMKQFEIYSSSQDISRDPFQSVDAGWQDGSNTWLGFGTNYFTATLIPFSSGVNSGYAKINETAHLRAMAPADNAKFKIYLGPKTLDDLRSAGFDLDNGIDLGWFAFIGQPILAAIKLLYTILGNFGLAIILLTILIKAALLPLTKTSFQSMKAMQDLQPEIQALKEKHADQDQAQLQQEILALYKKKGVNPMGGCFPMLLQLPVFLGMFNALRTSIDLRHAPFALWINDLASPEQLVVMGISIPVMILLMGASMFAQQLVTPNTATDPAQRKMMLFMPVIFTGMFLIWPFPAGLVLYWLVNNVISIIQQTAMRTEKNISPLMATIVSGVVVFAIAFVLTLL